MVRVDEPPRHFVHEQLAARSEFAVRGCGTRIVGPSRRCGGSFAEQVAGNVENGEAPTLLRERLGIRLDENLDGLFAGINLDTNRRVAEIDLVPSPVFSSNYGVGIGSGFQISMAAAWRSGCQVENRGMFRATSHRSVKVSTRNPPSRARRRTGS